MQTVIQKFFNLYESDEKISVVTCYDYSFARILNLSNVDCVLVGDSLGMVIQGESSTLPVTLEDMIYHTKAVRRGYKGFVITDLPFLSYQTSFEKGIESAGRILKEAKADAVKLEGADEFVLKQVERLSKIGVPVMGHLGLTPQSFQILGGYKVQGKDLESRKKILKDAKNLQEAGAFSLVLEMIPENLAKEITESLKIPTIGIGAGRYTSGQVLVLQDLLGMNSNFNPKFLKKFTNLEEIVLLALNTYNSEVKKNLFPSQENVFE
jgi:3-methyl-2-oxobutanoate hydroxymethyltransferase